MERPGVPLGDNRRALSPWVAGGVSVGLVVVLPFIHIGIFHLHFWVPNKRPVDHDNCTCTCWDTVFKGSYESQKNIKYKHIYFNATKQTYAIFVLTAAIFVLVYESFKRLLTIGFRGQLRYSMLTLILLDIYPHYYSWWMYFNYINDGFYKQFQHATFFAVTELFSSILIFSMCSTENPVDPRKILTIIGISIVHLIVGGIDQFFVQLVLGRGRMFQKMRNLGFLLPDIIHIVIPLRALKEAGKRGHVISRHALMVFCLAVSFFVFIGKVILK